MHRKNLSQSSGQYSSVPEPAGTYADARTNQHSHSSGKSTTPAGADIRALLTSSVVLSADVVVMFSWGTELRVTFGGITVVLSLASSVVIDGFSTEDHARGLEESKVVMQLPSTVGSGSRDPRWPASVRKELLQ
mmetsp:Transcript_67969/g.163165  ORF Transcript_67969/g.163165 Transcript_67969/m.163165 type:complete len:134 (-) Transcript_67969:2136-2537(-)